MLRHRFSTPGSKPSGNDGKRWWVLADLAQRFDLKTFAEIGVKMGKMSGELLKLLPEATLIAVDPWVPCGFYYEWNSMAHRRNEARFDQVAHQFPGRIRKLKMTSAEAAALIPDGSLDCVFIDGDHSYEAVRIDIDCWLPKVRRGGILSGHDYDNTVKYGNRFKGVDRAVNESFAGRINLGTDHVWWVQI